MSFTLRTALAFVLTCTLGLSTASAITLPYTENFDSSAENWKNSVTALTQDATWISGGGPNGASDPFIKSTFTTASTGTPSASQVLFRARNTVNSSDNEFFGNWITNGADNLDFWIRHDAATPLFIGLRVPTSAGFPAMLGRFPVAVEPNTWTHLSMAINATNPQLLDETGSTHNNFNPVFSNVTYLQVFANLSGVGTSTTVNFDLDGVTLVPEPSTWAMAALGLVAMGFVARRRKA